MSHGAGQIFGVQEQKGRGVWFIRKICAQKKETGYNYASTSLGIHLKLYQDLSIWVGTPLLDLKSLETDVLEKMRPSIRKQVCNERCTSNSDGH